MKPLERLVNTGKAYAAVVKTRIDYKNSQTGEMRFMQLSTIGKLAIALSTLKPAEFKYWLLVHNSMDYGSKIFDEIFPQYRNPGKFHSTDISVRLDEEPFQEYGSDYWDRAKTKGETELGLNSQWIEAGFDNRANERGINLEWSLFIDTCRETCKIHKMIHI